LNKLIKYRRDAALEHNIRNNLFSILVPSRNHDHRCRGRALMGGLGTMCLMSTDQRISEVSKILIFPPVTQLSPIFHMKSASNPTGNLRPSETKTISPFLVSQGAILTALSPARNNLLLIIVNPLFVVESRLFPPSLSINNIIVFDQRAH